MKVRNTLIAGVVALGLLGGAVTTASVASASPDVRPPDVVAQPVNKVPNCQPKDIMVPRKDRLGRWHCVFAPKPGRHNRHDRERRNNQ